MPFSIIKSGLPHDTVLGPLLFFIYFNDIESEITSSIRLFADDDDADADDDYVADADVVADDDVADNEDDADDDHADDADDDDTSQYFLMVTPLLHRNIY